MNWNKYNCAITTRHGNYELYQHCIKFLVDIPYKKIALKNTNSDSYLVLLLKLKYDYIINNRRLPCNLQ